MTERKLDGVDLQLGYIASVETIFSDDGGCTVTKLVIKPHIDLLIQLPLHVELHSNPAIHEKGVYDVIVVDRNNKSYFSGDAVMEKNGRVELSLPFLKKYKYPMSVWFFAVRFLLRDTSLEKWRGSVLLGDFWHVYPSDAKPPLTSPTPTLRLVPGSGRNRGMRKYMEDVEVLFESVRIHDKQTVALYGVLDGHGGEDCAQHISDDIPMKVTANMRRGLNCADALFKAFQDADEEYLANSSGNTAGSTANVVLFDKTSQYVYIANTGDTRAILYRNKAALNLSFDRKATDPEEIARISLNGGFVVNNRVSGSLAVSRAFGDASLKFPQRNILVPDPEISFFVPCVGDEFMVVATDGLWDVMSSQEVGDWVHAALSREGVLGLDSTSSSPEELKPVLSKVADELTRLAIQRNSQDNVTVMLILIQGACTEGRVWEEYVRRKARSGAVSTAVTRGSDLDDADDSRGFGFGLGKGRDTSESKGSSGLYSNKIKDLEDNSLLSYASSVAASGKADMGSWGESKVKEEKKPSKKLDEDDDDLMSFLKDDSNF